MLTGNLRYPVQTGKRWSSYEVYGTFVPVHAAKLSEVCNLELNNSPRHCVHDLARRGMLRTQAYVTKDLQVVEAMGAAWDMPGMILARFIDGEDPLLVYEAYQVTVDLWRSVLSKVWDMECTRRRWELRDEVWAKLCERWPRLESIASRLAVEIEVEADPAVWQNDLRSHREAAKRLSSGVESWINPDATPEPPEGAEIVVVDEQGRTVTSPAQTPHMWCWVGGPKWYYAEAHPPPIEHRRKAAGRQSHRDLLDFDFREDPAA